MFNTLALLLSNCWHGNKRERTYISDAEPSSQTPHICICRYTASPKPAFLGIQILCQRSQTSWLTNTCKQRGIINHLEAPGAGSTQHSIWTPLHVYVAKHRHLILPNRKDLLGGFIHKIGAGKNKNPLLTLGFPQETLNLFLIKYLQGWNELPQARQLRHFINSFKNQSCLTYQNWHGQILNSVALSTASENKGTNSRYQAI